MKTALINKCRDLANDVVIKLKTIYHCVLPFMAFFKFKLNHENHFVAQANRNVMQWPLAKLNVAGLCADTSNFALLYDNIPYFGLFRTLFGRIYK